MRFTRTAGDARGREGAALVVGYESLVNHNGQEREMDTQLMKR